MDSAFNYGLGDTDTALSSRQKPIADNTLPAGRREIIHTFHFGASQHILTYFDKTKQAVF